MLITRRSTWSDITRTKLLPITEEQMELYRKGELMSVCFPHLSLADREFILTGMTEEEFNQMVDRQTAELPEGREPEEKFIFGERSKE